MTPKEAADLANEFLGIPPNTHQKIQGFLASESPRNIQQFIHFLNQSGSPRYYELARTAIEIRLAEDADKLAKELTEQTDRLISETLVLRQFTKGLFWLTVAVVFLTAVLIVIGYLDYSAKTNEGFDSSIDCQSPQTNQTSK